MNSPSELPYILLQKLQSRTRVSPRGEMLQLEVDSHACGWVSPVAATTLQQKGLASLHDNRLQTTADQLADIAAALHKEGLLKGWRHEALDVLADNDRVLGQIERAAMRPLGLRTRAVHLHALGPNNRLWIARRAAHKSTDPGMWDTLVGGLVGAGESLDHALLRECNEEAGLVATDLAHRQTLGQFIVRRDVPEGYQVESTWVSICRLPDSCQPQNRDGEVDCIELATFDEVLHAIEQEQFTIEAAISILLWYTSTQTV